jgi:hypothetical protein
LCYEEVMMSKGNRIHGSEDMRRPSVSVPDLLLDEFDEWAEERYENRSEAIQALMRNAVNSGPDLEYDTPLQPPADEVLSRGYRRLCLAASGDGVVPHESAKITCSNGPSNLSKQEATRMVLRPLRERGYLRRLVSVDVREGSSAWKIVGWDDWDGWDE